MQKLVFALAFLVGLVTLAMAQAPPPVPALPDAQRMTSYSLSGSTCACSVGFQIYGDGTDVDQWIDVFVNGVSYQSTDLTFGWSLSSATGSLGNIPRPITNAILTFASPQTGNVVIVGARRPRRLSQFSEGAGVSARALNQVITDLTATQREAWDQGNRTIRGQPTDLFNPLPSASSRANGMLMFDGGGQPVVSTFVPPVITTAPDTLTAHCYHGDGGSHPLSTVTSCAGINTTGFTLAQWQVLLPAATSLANEVDWAALQSIINAATGPQVIRLPPGTAMLNLPLSVCTQSISIFGSGNIASNNLTTTTMLNFTGGTDGITHCAGATTTLQLQDIGLNSTTLTGSLHGINDASAYYDYLRNVQILGFNNGILFNNPGGTRLLSVWVQNGQPHGVDTTSAGITYTGAGFINRITDTVTRGFAFGYVFNSTPVSSTGLEDIQVINSVCGDVWKCITIESTNPGYGPFIYAFINMSADAAGSFISAPQCNGLLVSGGNWLMDPTVGSWTSGLNLIDLGTTGSGCHGVRLRDLWFGNNAVAAPASFVTVESTTNDVIISGVHMETSSVTVGAAWYQVGASATNVIERDTQWFNFFAPIDPPANAIFNVSSSPTNKLQSGVLGRPTVSACGTSPVIGAISNGEQGFVTMGTGSPTGCTLSFPLSRAVVPSCIVLSRLPGTPVTPTTISQSQITWTNSATSNLVVDYKCTPY